MNSGEKIQTLVDRAIRMTIGLLALLLGLLLVLHNSGDPALWGRYSLAYACFLMAYVPFLLSALWLAVRGGTVLGVFRQVLSIRLFQVGCTVLLLLFSVILWRYLQNRNGVDQMRAMAVGFIAAAYITAAVGVAGRYGIVRAKAWLINLALLVGSLLFTAAAGAVLLKINESNQGDVVSPSEIRQVNELRRTPNAEFIYHGMPGRTREFSYRIKNDSLGFHDHERVFENTEGRYRIVVLGDSYVDAAQVPMGRSFTGQLEELLNREEDRYEVIPLGRSGVGQEEELRNLEEVGIRFAPDIVIVLFVSNDLYDNDPELNEAYRTYVHKWSPSPHKPRALLFPELAIDRWLTARLYALVARWGYLIDPGLEKQTIRPDSLAILSLEEPAVKQALIRTKSLLDAIVARAAEEDIDLIFAARPNLMTREEFIRNNPGFRSADVDIDRLSRWLEAYAASRGARFVDLKTPFIEHLENGGAPLRWVHDGHWNEAGHQVVAEAIFRSLQEP